MKINSYKFELLKGQTKNSLLELLQQYENMLDMTFEKYTGSNYTMESKEDAKPFSIPKINSQGRS